MFCDPITKALLSKSCVFMVFGVWVLKLKEYRYADFVAKPKRPLKVLRNKIKSKNLFFVVCPNANLYIENSIAPVDLFQNENLNLAMVANAMDMSSHQLSELINVHFGMSFSKYIREQRIYIL